MVRGSRRLQLCRYVSFISSVWAIRMMSCFFNITGFNVRKCVRGPDGEVIAHLAFNTAIKATGLKLYERQDCFFRVTANKKGKLVHATMHWGPGKVAEEAALVPNGEFIILILVLVWAI